MGSDPSALILGDNLYFGHGLTEQLSRAAGRAHGATVFGYRVNDPERYGVVEFDKKGRAISIEEKPSKPKSNYAVTGLYFYDGRAAEFAKKIKPSTRGELEITALNNIYLEENELAVEITGPGLCLAGHRHLEPLIQAGEFVRILEARQGLKVGCPEEIAYRMGFINRDAVGELGRAMAKTSYGQYLLSLAEDEDGPA